MNQNFVMEMTKQSFPAFRKGGGRKVSRLTKWCVYSATVELCVEAKPGYTGGFAPGEPLKD